MPDVDAIVIPVGGGGLIAGVALAVKTMKPDVLIIGVEPEVTSRHQGTPPLKKAIPQSLGSLFPQNPHSERTPADSEYDVG